MKKRIIVFVTCFMILWSILLCDDGPGNGGLSPYFLGDRFRNIAAVDGNAVYLTSFGLEPLNPNLHGIPAFLFRAGITNSIFSWNFTGLTWMYFNEDFNTYNAGTPGNMSVGDFDCNGYNQEDENNMQSYFTEEENNARRDGGTGSWASPVLDLNNNTVIVLNKSGVIMGIASSFQPLTYCVNWAFDLRNSERSISSYSSKHEYMATPTKLDNEIFIAGIYGIFRINTVNLTWNYIQTLNDNTDHYIAPVTTNLESTQDSKLICVSRKGKLTILSNELVVLSNFYLDTDVIVPSKPIVDNDGMVYIAANNGRIFYFHQDALLSPSFSMNDVTILPCADNDFISTCITNSTQDFYAFSTANDAIRFTESYDFSNNNPLSNSWNAGSGYLYDDQYSNCKGVNNHSVIFEKQGIETSCLFTIYNDDQLYDGEEEYYDNYDPATNDLLIRQFYIDNSENPQTYPSEFSRARINGVGTSSFGGLAAYRTNSNNRNLLFLDESGYAWSWPDHIPSNPTIFPYTADNPLISSFSNPKFMRDLSNIPIYDKNETVTVNIFGWVTTSTIDKIFLNSYMGDATYVSLEDRYYVVLDNILNHPNYTIGIRTTQNDTYSFENIPVNGPVVNLDIGTLTISGVTPFTISGGSHIYNNIIVEEGATLNIYQNAQVYVLNDLTIYNGAFINILDNSILDINGNLISDKDNSDDYSEIQTSIFSPENHGFLIAEFVLVELQGKIKFQGGKNDDLQTNGWLVAGNVEIASNEFYGDSPTVYINGNCLINGLDASMKIKSGCSVYGSTIDIMAGATLELGQDLQQAKHYFANSTINVDNFEIHNGSSALDISYYSKMYLNNSNINILYGGDMTLYDRIDPGTIPSELHLQNFSTILIDGYDVNNTPSKFYIDWGTTITGATAGYYVGEDYFEGDRIIAQNGGMITTSFNTTNPGDVITITSENLLTVWDGIIINSPHSGNTNDDKYWFVNCDFKFIRNLDFTGKAQNPSYAGEMKIFYSDFQNAGQILVKDGNTLTYNGSDTDVCNIMYNNAWPICTYETSVDLQYLNVNDNQGGISLYDSGGQSSVIENCIFNENGNLSMSDGVKLNNTMIGNFSNNVISGNTGHGILAIAGTTFPYIDNFISNTFENNDMSEYCGYESSFNMGFYDVNLMNSFTHEEEEDYIVIDVDWEKNHPGPFYQPGDAVDVTGTDLISSYITAERMCPAMIEAWYFGSESSEEKLMLLSAEEDISNENYDDAESTLYSLINLYPESKQARTAVYYLYHIECVYLQNYVNLIDNLTVIDTHGSVLLEDTIETVKTKGFMKNQEYLLAIQRLEYVINTSTDPDEVILAMIDEGYCYLKLQENGSRSLPVECSVKTRNEREYQAKVRELEQELSFYYLNQNTHNVPSTESLVLHNNYPNPFNPTTTISFDLPHESDVILNVYNVKGQKVKQLANDQFDKGSHSVSWNGYDDSGKPVASGIYFYKLVSGKQEKVRKMLLLK